MSVDFDFSQVEHLAVEFGTAAATIAVKNETMVLTPTAREVQSEASARAPRLTGAQAAGYYVKSGGRGERIITNDTREAFYQELGTSRHPPQPALFPAGDKGGDQMAKRLEEIADPLP